MNALERMYIRLSTAHDLKKSFNTPSTVIRINESSIQSKIKKKYSNMELLTIYYLFMNIDGECSELEKQNFSVLCEELKATDEQKAELINSFDKLIADKQNEDISGVISLKILEILGLVDGDMFEESSTLPVLCIATGVSSPGFGSKEVNLNNKSDKLGFVWTLINLAYCDGTCGEAEEQILEVICEELAIDDITVIELKDTAQTLFMLFQQKEWLKVSGKTYDEITSALAKTDEQIAKLIADIKIIISEND